MKAKTNVYVSEVHGMAQRGGAVVCIVRMEDVSCPLIATGTADVIVSTEPVEALRNIGVSRTSIEEELGAKIFQLLELEYNDTLGHDHFEHAVAKLKLGLGQMAVSVLLLVYLLLCLVLFCLGTLTGCVDLLC